MARIVYTDSSSRECSVYLGPDQPVVSIGRATDCTIRSNRKSVSRHHAEFRFNNGAFEVIDLNSSNGTWLIENEQRFEIAHERLEDQDEIWCGDFIVHFLVDDDAEKELTVNDQHPSGQNSTGQNSTGEQGYVSGPTEAADAFEFDGGNFGAEPSEAHQDGGVGLDQHSSVAFDYDEVEELGADDLVELDNRPASGGYSGEAHAGDEVERLLQEKQSIEDLASRQAFEIEELQAKLEQASQQLEQNGGAPQQQLEQALGDVEALRRENQELREQLDAGQHGAAKAEELAAELENERHQVEALRSELQSTGDELAGARQRIEKVQEQESTLEQALAEKNARVESLELDVRTLEEELAAAGGAGDDVEKVREQLEKSDRLLNEYERRNAELRTELDEQHEINEELRQAAEQNEEKLAELFDTRDTLQRQLAELEPIQVELDEKREALEQAEELNADLKAEVQGLKQRLQLERRRSDEDITEELERLEAELIEATELISELEQQREDLSGELAEAIEEKEAAGGGFDPEELAEIRQRLSALERLADAIDRTDLEPLSTVDRIRLQSAIRETNPKKTLQEALDLLT